MKKIGFIDYFLDEWHANNYPDWIRETAGPTDGIWSWLMPGPISISPAD